MASVAKNQYVSTVVFSGVDLNSLKGLYQAWIDANPNCVVVSTSYSTNLAQAMPRLNAIQCREFTGSDVTALKAAYEAWVSAQPASYQLFNITRYVAGSAHYWHVDYYMVTSYDANTVSHFLVVAYTTPNNVGKK